MTIQEKIIHNDITSIDFLEELYSNTKGETNSKYIPDSEVNFINLSFINTIYFSEALCKRYDLNSKDEKTFQPELGLMLIKKILYDSLNLELLTPKLLVSIFNKNQELIEIPYIYALYLGGLHYFNTNKNIGLKREFKCTNNLLFKDINKNIIYDIYDKIDDKTEIITRDRYHKIKETIEFNNDEKNGKGEDIKVNIQNLSTLNGLACGYGIQHNFLNKYYELLFDKSISEANNPYAMIGGYNGIIKPLKINSGGYNVDDSIDFIGLYRNVCVTERAFANITDDEIINDVRNSNFFLAYSKLKAKYLSGLYSDTEFETMCKRLDNQPVGSILFSEKSFSQIVLTQIFNQNIVKENFFGSEIKALIDKAHNSTDKMILVLKEMWALEKNNMLNQYSKISKSTYCLIPSAGGVINFDSTLTIDELNNNTSDISYGFLCNLQKILWFEDNLSVNSLMDNNNLPNNFFQRNTFTDSVEEINPKNGNLLYYFNTLLDSLDIEKLEYFTNLFTDFCDMKQKNNDNGYTLRSLGYTLRSLLLGITTIGYDDISDTNVYIRNNTLTFTKDEINALLIGNSVYTYDSFYDHDISIALNIALTQAQFNNYQKIRKDFINNKITIANLSTIGPLKYKDSPELSLHKIITLPEIMFSNATNYDEVIANLKTINDDDEKNILFLTRRLLFNNQFVEEFSVLKTWENMELRELNNIYMIHPSFLKGDKNLDDITNTVIKFFETLNIKYSKDNYLLLLRLIRGFVYHYYNNKGEINVKLN